ncbi:sulfite exporter TauE/SafE family protein [Rhizorhabdus dicambivorans]|uniref:Probable membrane transporter protein n=1 Tax=Rhizorhabdus dicambivorans TaxID=1850238 RepID=A0A2A4FV22_9SPHN|nr:sulfite exporter TauE/SafE family protein [Rhizorhabdus dicambivorans]ATE64095.1 sulfite exporter TauE/SafE family protein [Rhizorhabdus dicambivorans]PCE42631.1 sulfite exporter TauE/SafE family protein [Rhizorhabdus dicambivorans]
MFTFSLPELTFEHLQALAPFIGVGFVAQLVDGALGMAFGVITNTMLVSIIGVAPARASASVHLVETFTTAASGISHIFHRNVDWKLFARLVLPGMVGGILGAYLLSNIDGSVARPFVMAYLIGIGFYLLWRAWRMDHGAEHKPARVIAPLGLVGGFLDAAGGGGWGPVVTSNLLVQGTEPRKTIGTVNTAEFFLTFTISLTFVFTLGIEAFTIAAVGLIIGGLLAAPLGALLVRRIPAKRLLTMVGIVLVATSLFSLWKALS